MKDSSIIEIKKDSTQVATYTNDAWGNKGMLDPNKTAIENAIELLNNKWGKNNWHRGPGTEFNKIVKWLVRSLGYK